MPRVYENFKPTSNKALAPVKETKTPPKPVNDKAPDKDNGGKSQAVK